MSPDLQLDAIDRRILQSLQANGRASFEELADKLGLSASATLRRVRRLEDAGVIAGYVAIVAPERVGLGLSAYISVRLAKGSDLSRSPIDDFAAAVQAWPEVVECAALTGEMDYLLRVMMRDMAQCSSFIMDRLLKHPSVLDCKTSFMMRRLKGTTALPL